MTQYRMPKPWRDPIFAREGLPLPGPLGQAQDAPGSPAVRIRTLRTDLAASDLITVVVHEPTLVKVTSLELDTTTDAAALTLNWQLLEDNGSGADYYALVPFFGPYAWLSIPGVYEIRANVASASTAQILTYSLLTGLDDRTVSMLLDPHRSHYWQGEQVVIGAGLTEPLWSEPERFPAYKRVIIRNTTSNTVLVNLNGSAVELQLGSGGTTGMMGPGTGALELGPDFLGRSTVTLTSTVGSTVYAMIAQW